MKEIKIDESGFIKQTITTVHEIKWISFPFFAFDGSWKLIKTKQYGELRKRDSHCFICDDEFEDNEKMGLIAITGHVNILCCESCCTEASSKSAIKMYKPKR